MTDTLKHIARPQPLGEQRRPITALCGASAPPMECITTVTNDAVADCWRCIAIHCGKPIPPEPPCPEHDRLRGAKKSMDATQLVHDFLEFLEEDGIILARRLGLHELTPDTTNRDRLLHKFFGTSQAKLESEKRALLDYVRACAVVEKWANERQSKR